MFAVRLPVRAAGLEEVGAGRSPLLIQEGILIVDGTHDVHHSRHGREHEAITVLQCNVWDGLQIVALRLERQHDSSGGSKLPQRGEQFTLTGLGRRAIWRVLSRCSSHCNGAPLHAYFQRVNILVDSGLLDDSD